MARKVSLARRCATIVCVVFLSLSTCALATPPVAVPKIDKTTPRAQDGLTLMAISRGNVQGMYQYPVPAGMSFLNGPSANGIAGGFGLWIRTPVPPPQKTGMRAMPEQYGFNGPTASCKELGGDAIPVQTQQIIGSYMNGQPPTPTLFFVSLPAGYPTPFDAIDVTVKTASGHQAKWQLIDLPPSYNALPENTPLNSVFSQDGVVLKASAYISQMYGYYGGPAGTSNSATSINYQVTGTVPANTHWQLRIMKQEMEWEALSPTQATLPGNYALQPYFRPPPVFSAYFGNSQNGSAFPRGMPMGLIMAPYAAYEHMIRLSGSLIKLATVTETMTFHNVMVRAVPEPAAMQPQNPQYKPPPSYAVYCQPQTVVTESGVSVTMLPFSDLPQNGQFFDNMGSGIKALLRFNGATPGVNTTALRHSPLFKQYQKPILLTLTGAKPLLLQNIIPVNSQYMASVKPTLANEFVATLSVAGGMHQVQQEMNGHKFTTFQQSAPQKFLSSLSFILTQEADLHSVPVSFVVPVSSMSPANQRIPFSRRGPLPAFPMHQIQKHAK